MTDVRITLTPMLSVAEAKKAIQFYMDAFGAQELYLESAPDGALYGAVSIGDARVEITSEAPDHGNSGPLTGGGPSIRLSLMVPDPDAVATRAVAAGARVIFPIADQPYGYRQGRIEDPFGHQWLIGRPLEDK
jgi:PhnB protein